MTKETKRILVCGSRDWHNQSPIWDALNHQAEHYDVILIQGGQRAWSEERGMYIGADYFAAQWADLHAVEHLPFPADWAKHRRAAGPIRNSQMLNEGKPEHVLAFTDDLKTSKGTRDMVLKSLDKGIAVSIWTNGNWYVGDVEVLLGKKEQ